MPATATYPHEAAPHGASAALAASLRALLPRIETARLILRAPEITDFAVFDAIFESPRAVYMGGPFDRAGAWDEFTECVSGWLLRGHGAWAITRKDSGETIGFTLIHMEYGDREPELGWYLSETAEGQGFAFEAANAARAHALDTLALPALVSYIDPPNRRSIRLAENLGAWRDDVAAADFDDDVLVYRHAPAADDGGMEAYS